jgi:hypothetical protein
MQLQNIQPFLLMLLELHIQQQQLLLEHGILYAMVMMQLV